MRAKIGTKRGEFLFFVFCFLFISEIFADNSEDLNLTKKSIYVISDHIYNIDKNEVVTFLNSDSFSLGKRKRIYDLFFEKNNVYYLAVEFYNSSPYYNWVINFQNILQKVDLSYIKYGNTIDSLMVNDYSCRFGIAYTSNQHLFVSLPPGERGKIKLVIRLVSRGEPFVGLKNITIENYGGFVYETSVSQLFAAISWGLLLILFIVSLLIYLFLYRKRYVFFLILHVVSLLIFFSKIFSVVSSFQYLQMLANFSLFLSVVFYLFFINGLLNEKKVLPLTRNVANYITYIVIVSIPVLFYVWFENGPLYIMFYVYLGVFVAIAGLACAISMFKLHDYVFTVIAINMIICCIGGFITMDMSMSMNMFRHIPVSIACSLEVLIFFFLFVFWSRRKINNLKFVSEQLEEETNLRKSYEHKIKILKVKYKQQRQSLDNKNVNEAKYLALKNEILNHEKVKSVLSGTGVYKMWNNEVEKEILINEIRGRHSEIVDFIQKNRTQLTPREIDICLFIMEGYTSINISEVYNTTIAAVNKSRVRIRKKLKIDSNVTLSDYLISDERRLIIDQQ